MKLYELEAILESMDLSDAEIFAEVEGIKSMVTHIKIEGIYNVGASELKVILKTD